MKRLELFWCITTVLGAGAMLAAFSCVPEKGGDTLLLTGFFGFGMLSVILLGLRDCVAWDRKAETRTEAMREAATRLGFAFFRNGPLCMPRATQPDATRRSFSLSDSNSFLCRMPATMALSENMLELPKGFDLTRDRWLDGGGVSYVRNVIEKTMDGASVAVFDLAKTRGEGVTMQTVFAVRSPKLEFPRFVLVPIGSLDRLNSQCHEDLFVEPSCISWLLDKGTCLEAGEGFLLLYRKKKLIAPEDIEPIVTTGLRIYVALSRHASNVELAVSGSSV